MSTQDTKQHLYKGKYGPMDSGLHRAMFFDFHNTPLQPYVVQATMFFTKDVLKKFDSIFPASIRMQIQPFVSECIPLAKCLRSVKLGEVKGTGWKITSEDDLLKIYDRMESLLLDKLDEWSWICEDADNGIIENAVVDEWMELFKDFPCRESMYFEDVETNDEGEEIEDGEKRLSLSEIDYLIKDLERYNKIAKNLKIDTDKKLITRFLEYMLQAGIPQSRGVYKELYRLLDNYGFISDEVKHSHKTTTSKYGESNYIKSLVNTILKNKEQNNN